MNATIENQIKSTLKEIISHDLELNIEKEDIEDHVSLNEEGIGLDSISIINFIVKIEKKFGFSFSEEEISIELFSSLNSLAAFISSKTE